MQCPRCSARTKQYKIGFNRSGSRKYRCYACKRTIHQNLTSRDILRAYACRRSNSTWKATACGVLGAFWKSRIKVSLIGSKPTRNSCHHLLYLRNRRWQSWMNSIPSLAIKNTIYILTIVDRATRCILSWDVVAERTSENMQACLERAPQARP